MKKYTYLTFISLFFPIFLFSQTFFRTGNHESPVSTNHEQGFLLDGGLDSPDAYTWMLQQADGGDVVVIRASGTDGYNNFFYDELGVTVNSVVTIVITSVAQANNPDVETTIRNAEVLFIAGGNQDNYLNYLKNTKAHDALNYLIHDKKATIGGSSAGMAVLGDIVFTAENGTVTSIDALSNPYRNTMTFVNDFLSIPILENVITDTHYDNPDRRGRHFAFLARNTTDWGIQAKGIASTDYTAVAIQSNGIARVFGDVPTEDFAYFLTMHPDAEGPETCENGTPLTWNRDGKAVKVYKVPGTITGDNTFNLNTWMDGTGGTWDCWYAITGTFSTTADCDPPVFSGPQPPQSLNAEATGSSEINIQWTKNADNDNVLLAWSANGTFGNPVDGTTYTAGNTIAGGGTVLDYGANASFLHENLNAATAYYYRVWSYDGHEYSSGISAHATTDEGAFELPYFENFETYTDNTDFLNNSNWSLIDADGDGRNWQHHYDETDEIKLMISHSWDGDALTPENYLITPRLNIGNYQSVELSFDIAASGNSFFAEHYKVVVSTTGNNLEHFIDDNIVIEETLTEVASNWGFQTRTVDLSAYMGEEIYIAFVHYNCTDQARLLLNNVVVSFVEGDAETYILTVNATSEEGGNPTGSGEYEEGEIITLNGNANTGWHLTGWYRNNDGTDLLGFGETLNFTMPAAATSITARYHNSAAPLLGDVNNDGSRNVLDIVWIVNFILDNPHANFNAAAADVNGDKSIDVNDVVALNNLILGGANKTTFESEKAWLLYDGNNIFIESDGTVSAIQFRIQSKNAELIDLSLLHDNFDFAYNVVNDVYIGVIYNFNNASFIDGMAELFQARQFPADAHWIELKASNSSGKSVDIELKNVTSVIESQQNATQIKVFPNPNKGSFTANLKLPSEAKVEMQLFDITGRNIIQKPAIQLQSGEHLIRFEEYLSTGFYMLRMRAFSPDGQKLLKSKELKVLVE